MDLCFLWQAVAELPLERLDEGGSADGKGGLPHLHLDILMITEDNRLSAKTLITRDFITSMHRIMPIILKKHGFNIDEYEETEEKKQGGLSAKEYKKKMEQEKEELNKKIGGYGKGIQRIGRQI